MKYLEVNLICLNVVSLSVGMKYDITYEFPHKGWTSIKNKNCCSYLHKHEWMKMEAFSCMIKYLPCFLVDF